MFFLPIYIFNGMAFSSLVIVTNDENPSSDRLLESDCRNFFVEKNTYVPVDMMWDDVYAVVAGLEPLNTAASKEIVYHQSVTTYVSCNHTKIIPEPSRPFPPSDSLASLPSPIRFQRKCGLSNRIYQQSPTCVWRDPKRSDHPCGSGDPKKSDHM